MSLFALSLLFGQAFSKTRISSEDGREQVTGFQMAGEIMGLDGIVTETHNCDAVALEDSEVCVMPFDRLESLCREVPVLQRHMNKVMSREIVRENQIMLLLGAMRAEERITAFILNLVQRLDLRGYSKSEIILRMNREEIGSYLGMTIETVSRTFSKLCDQSILETKHRYVKILDVDKLKALLR